MSKQLKKLLLLSALTFSLMTGAGTQAMAAHGCRTDIEVSIGSVTDAGGEGHRTQCFTVDVDRPGVLTLETTAPAWDAQPKLGFLGRVEDTPSFSASGFRTLVRFIGGTAVELSHPGTYRFRVAAQGPEATADRYQVRVGFLETLSTQPRGDILPARPRPVFLPKNSPEEEDSDVDPNLLPQPEPVFIPKTSTEEDSDVDPNLTPQPQPVFLPQNTVAEEEDSDVDPNLMPQPQPVFMPQNTVAEEEDSDVDPNLIPQPQPVFMPQNTVAEEEDSDVDPNLMPQPQPVFPPAITAGGEEEDSDVDPNLMPFRFAGLGADAAGCRDLVTDDHGDGFLCATPIRPGEERYGALEHGRVADLDTVSFTLSEQSDIRLAIVGDHILFGELFDHNGHRLAASEEQEMSWSATLAPGRYYIRVSSRDALGGAYGIALESSGW